MFSTNPYSVVPCSTLPLAGSVLVVTGINTDGLVTLPYFDNTTAVESVNSNATVNVTFLSTGGIDVSESPLEFVSSTGVAGTVDTLTSTTATGVVSQGIANLGVSPASGTAFDFSAHADNYSRRRTAYVRRVA